MAIRFFLNTWLIILNLITIIKINLMDPCDVYQKNKIFSLLINNQNQMYS